MGRQCATEVSAITRIRRRGRQRRYRGLFSGPSRCSARISLQRATQSPQIATPGPARTASTCPAGLEQNEHWRDGSEPRSRRSESKTRLGCIGLGRTRSNLTGLPPLLGLGPAAPARNGTTIARRERPIRKSKSDAAGVAVPNLICNGSRLHSAVTGRRAITLCGDAVTPRVPCWVARDSQRGEGARYRSERRAGAFHVASASS